MTSKLDAAADAICSAINAHDFAEPFLAEVRDLPDVRMEDLVTLNVMVIPRTRESTFATRGAEQVEYTIDVGVRKKVDSDSRAAVGPLRELTEAIGLHLRRKRLPTVGGAVVKVKETSGSTILLREQRAFQAVLTVTVRTLESLA